MSSILSIIIPTYNKPDKLLFTLNFLQTRSVRIPIVIADGSDAEHARRNSNCVHLGPNISYFHLSPQPSQDPWENYNLRVESSLDRVQTSYAVISAEDDLLVIENAVQAAEFLKANPQYLGCHGKYLHYERNGDQLEIKRVAYDGASIDGNEVTSRLMQLYSCYEAFFYAVFPTRIQRILFRRYREAERPLWPELYHSTAAVIEGRIRRMDNLYSLRDVGEPPHYQPIEDFVRWVAQDFDDFLIRYQAYRDRIAEWSSGRADLHVDQARLRRAVDMGFAVYAGRMFSLPYWIDEYAAVAIADPEEQAALCARLRQNFSRTTILPFGESLRHVAKSMLGPQGVRFFQRARTEGVRMALQRIPQCDWRRWKGKPAGEMAGAELRIPPDLTDLFPAKQWDLIR